MGLFDYLRCDYPLPLEGANALEFQTKDTRQQYMDRYEIRADGTLWHEEYDTEDRSDPNAEGLERMFGCMTRVNQRWVRDEMTGEVCFYTSSGDRDNDQWIEFSCYFVKGALKHLEVLSPCPADATSATPPHPQGD
jgi:hypothetical protein